MVKIQNYLRASLCGRPFYSLNIGYFVSGRLLIILRLVYAPLLKRFVTKYSSTVLTSIYDSTYCETTTM